MTPRSDDLIAADLSAADPAATIYLPSLDRARLVALLDSVRGPRGVAAPRDWRLQDAAPTAVHQL
jgi:hypothetical protein